jgi:hypothetical protein
MVNHSYAETFNLDYYLTNSSRWSKLPFISDEFQAVFNFITNTSTARPMPTLRNFHRHPFGIFAMAILTLIILLLIALVYCHFTRRPRLPLIYLPVPNPSGNPPTA